MQTLLRAENMSSPWNIDRVNKFLKDEGNPIELLDGTFENARFKHNWKCKYEKHEFPRKFEQILSDIKNKKSPCKSCSKDNTLEDRARYCFETIFNKQFPKKYPKWLHLNKGDPKELDGYNEELRLAFEYDGAQHYDENNYFNKTSQDFKDLEFRDRLKDFRCKEQGIELIRIMYDECFVSNPTIILDKIPNKLKSKIRNRDIDFGNYTMPSNRLLIFEIKEYAIKRGGKCKSTKINEKSEVDLYCPIHKYTWSQKPKLVLSRESWCKHCGNLQTAAKQKQIPTEDELKEIGKKLKSTYQSSAGLDADNRYLWKCGEDKNHFPFKKNYSEMKKAYENKKCPCPECNSKRRRMGWEAHRYAEKKGGECLTYETKKGKKEKYQFKCHNKDHETFERTLAQIVDSKMWCDNCEILEGKKPQRHSQNYVSKIALKKNFNLKNVYENNNQLLDLSCTKCGQKKRNINYRKLEKLKDGHNCDHC
tara:strand:+ start:364 stop:1797 length:1434 start_codon:yes stop_codon:yes gene_type:complete